jgi:hypothetical protein
METPLYIFPSPCAHYRNRRIFFLTIKVISRKLFYLSQLMSGPLASVEGDSTREANRQEREEGE